MKLSYLLYAFVEGDLFVQDPAVQMESPSVELKKKY